MRFNKIKINNYGLFKGYHEFLLKDRGLQFIVGINKDGTRANSNGSGKSTLFEALEYCIFGEIPKSDNVDSIINIDSGKDCWVELELEDDENKLITIKRFRKLEKSNGVAVNYDGSNKTALDSDQTQKIINDILGMNRDVFHACVFFSQTGRWKFCEKLNSDIECLEVLTKVLQLEDIDTWLNNAKEEKKKIDVNVEKISMNISAYSNQLSVLDTMDFNKKIQEYEELRSKKIENTLKICAEKMVELQKLEKDIINTEEYEKALKELEKIVIYSPQIPSNLLEINTSIGKCTNQLDNFRNKYNELQKAIEDLTSNVISRCRLCGQLIEKKNSPEHIIQLKKEIDEISIKSIELNKNLNNLVEEKKKITELYQQQQFNVKKEQEEHNKKISNLKDLIYKNRQIIQTINTIKSEAVRYYQDCENIKKELNPYISEQDRIEKEKNKLIKIIDDNTKLLEENKKEQEAYSFWIEAFGPKGLKNYILDSKLDMLTQAANEWIGLLTDNKFYIKFESQTQGAKGKVRNKLKMRVFQLTKNDKEIEYNYESWSGGEKARISLGVDLGLSQLIATRSKKTYNILIMDEIFKHLDNSGIQAVVEMLHKLIENKESIFVIDHSSDFLSNFENIITIERNNNCSKII